MAAALRITVDARQLLRMAETFRKAGVETRPAEARAINHTGDKTRTRVIRALVKQMGTTYGVVNKALGRPIRANPASLAYVIRVKGPALSLKEFKARPTRKGVSAAPWGTRRVFPHSFIAPSMGGHVFVRTSRARFPVKKLWGPAVPNELVRNQSKAAFEATVATELPARLAYELGRILGR